ncbi:hypothetical protein D9M73_249830 [compost metagenome]
MDDARLGIAVLLQAGDQAILVVVGAAGHRKQQGGLVDHQQGVVPVDECDLGKRHGSSGNEDGGRSRRRGSNRARVYCSINVRAG